MSRIYVATSWRNEEQPNMVNMLRADGHEVYDFRNPPGQAGFGWEQIDPEWRGLDSFAILPSPAASISGGGIQV